MIDIAFNAISSVIPYEFLSFVHGIGSDKRFYYIARIDNSM